MCLQEICILGMWDKKSGGRGGGEGGIFPCRGTPILNEPVSQYSRWVNLSKTDDNDRTHGNNANALS